MRTLEGISQRLELRREKLGRALSEIVRQLKEMGAIKVILFGSFASQKISFYSDLDIFVIMPDIKSGKEWLKEIYQRLERYVASDIIVFNLKEFEESKDKNFLLEEIERKGRVIYEERI